MVLRYLASLVAVLVFIQTAVASDAEAANILVNEIERASNQSLLWGPYNPSLYFGMRPAERVIVESSTRLTATAPLGVRPGPVDVRMENEHGSTDDRDGATRSGDDSKNVA